VTLWRAKPRTSRGEGFLALLAPQALRQNSLRAEALRSNNCRKSVHEARCARGPAALRCSALASDCPPQGHGRRLC
jgi:hypothetical protein